MKESQWKGRDYPIRAPLALTERSASVEVHALRALVVTLLIGASACDHPPGPPPEAAPGCNPVAGDDCLTPFPSSFYEAVDATTATGVRVAIAADALPRTSSNPPIQIKSDRYDHKDGFSPATPLVVYFAAGVGAAQLPTADDPSATLTPSGVVQLLDMADGARVPVFAELDVNAGPGDRQALLIHPLVRLAPSHHYVCALLGLLDGKGQAISTAPFRALRDGTPLSQSLTPLAARYDEIFALLDKAGVARSALTLAWDFHTASDATATGHLTAMVARALPQVPTLKWTIVNSTDNPAPHVLREIAATFETPSFLTDESPKAALAVDAKGAPMQTGLGSAQLLVHIPSCATTASAPLPVMVYGHGLFNDVSELDDPYLEELGDTLCMVRIATNWTGLATDDTTLLASWIPGDLNRLTNLTDRLQQAHVNAQVMARLFATRMKDDPAFAVGGHAVTDGKQLYYYGNSDGGIQGATFMALSADVTRGVLGVPGCEWSLMLFRAYAFGGLIPVLNSLLPDTLDQQVLVAVSQSEWDYTDPATFAPHLLAESLAGVPPKRILLEESMGDAQVPNVATRVLARTMGAPGLDLEAPVFGVAVKTAPLDSAYTQWDVHPTPLPPSGNTPPRADNSAHEAVRRLPLAQKQLAAFLTPDGEVIHVCGPCSF